jgi:hypothetical protein
MIAPVRGIRQLGTTLGLAFATRVGPDYYAALGRSAYAGVAAATRAGYAELFAQLALAFNAMRQVLLGVGRQVDSGIASEASLARAEGWAGIRVLNS